MKSESQVIVGVSNVLGQDEARPRARLAAVVLAASLVTGCGTVQKSYWDSKVTEMCRKDGGVTVYERVRITRDQYRALGGSDGRIPVNRLLRPTPGVPYAAQLKTDKLNEDPEVNRYEAVIVRTTDKKILSRSVIYGRVGGDGIKPHSCMELGMSADLDRQTFEIEGE